MSKFDETVQKIASSPDKARMFRLAPHFLVKEAGPGVLRKLFGGGPSAQREGYQDILKGIATAVGVGAIQGSGALLMDQMASRWLGDPNEAKATSQEKGKLIAQNTFKAQMNTALAPRHDTVYKKVIKDEVIAKADRKMIESAYETMKRFAPNLAADENATRSFLREHAIYGTGPSYASLKNLAEAEQAIARAGGALGG